MRRVIYLLLVLAIALAVLNGCEKKQEEPTTQAEPDTTQMEADQPSDMEMPAEEEVETGEEMQE